jgi:hypothetical protein
MMPTNNRLKAVASDQAVPGSRLLIKAWGRLHAVRSGLGVAAMLAYLWALN